MSIRTFVGLFDCKLVELLTGVFYWLDYCVKLVVVLGGVGICAVDFVLAIFIPAIFMFMSIPIYIFLTPFAFAIATIRAIEVYSFILIF